MPLFLMYKKQSFIKLHYTPIHILNILLAITILTFLGFYNSFVPQTYTKVQRLPKINFDSRCDLESIEIL